MRRSAFKTKLSPVKLSVLRSANGKSKVLKFFVFNAQTYVKQHYKNIFETMKSAAFSLLVMEQTEKNTPILHFFWADMGGNRTLPVHFSSAGRMSENVLRDLSAHAGSCSVSSVGPPEAGPPSVCVTWSWAVDEDYHRLTTGNPTPVAEHRPCTYIPVLRWIWMTHFAEGIELCNNYA